MKWLTSLYEAVSINRPSAFQGDLLLVLFVLWRPSGKRSRPVVVVFLLHGTVVVVVSTEILSTHLLLLFFFLLFKRPRGRGSFRSSRGGALHHPLCSHRSGEKRQSHELQIEPFLLLFFFFSLLLQPHPLPRRPLRFVVLAFSCLPFRAPQTTQGPAVPPRDSRGGSRWEIDLGAEHHPSLVVSLL